MAREYYGLKWKERAHKQKHYEATAFYQRNDLRIGSSSTYHCQTRVDCDISLYLLFATLRSAIRSTLFVVLLLYIWCTFNWRVAVLIFSRYFRICNRIPHRNSDVFQFQWLLKAYFASILNTFSAIADGLIFFLFLLLFLVGRSCHNRS